MTGPSDHVDTDQEPAPPWLAESAERHKARLSVYRDYGPDERWEQRPVGLDLELRGIVFREGLHITEHGAKATYDALRGIAEWAFRVLDANPQVTYEIDEYDQHIVLADPLPEVELFGHVYHRADVNRPLDDAERKAVDQVRERLRSVGVRGG
jgi:hypothetical protein